MAFSPNDNIARGSAIQPASSVESPRERLDRLLVVLKRTRMYVLSSTLVALVGFVISIIMAFQVQRIWRSEATVLYRDAIQTDGHGPSASQRALKLGPKLKDLLGVRSRLSSLIAEFDLYPEIASRSMSDAIEEVRKNVGFRARNSDTFVLSFSYTDPVVAQRVTNRLAEVMIEEYHQQNLDAAMLTRDFLRRELAEAENSVEDASRSLSLFLSRNPQFQWGPNDSPYALPASGTTGMSAGQAPFGLPSAPEAKPGFDPELSAMRQKLAAVDDELKRLVEPNLTGLAAAQKQRDSAAGAVFAAEQVLEEKLRILTPAHPDAVAARARVQAAHGELAAADRQLAGARAAANKPVAGPNPARQSALEAERSLWQRRIDERIRKLNPAAAPAGVAVAPSVTAQPPGSTAAEPSADGAQPPPNVVDLETEWHRLHLELERAREHFRSVQAKEQAADMSADAVKKKSDEEMVIVDPAYLPVRPDRGPRNTLLAGVTVTLFMTIAFASLRVLLNDTVFDEGDIHAIGGSPVLAALPRMTMPRVQPCAWSAPVQARPHITEPHPPRPIAPPKAPAPVVEAEPVPADEIPVSWHPGSVVAAGMHAVTIRFGSPEPRSLTGTLVSGMDSVDPSDIEDTAPLSIRLPDAVVEAVIEEPEVEVIASVLEYGPNSPLACLANAPGTALAALRVLRHRLEQHRDGGHCVVSVVSPRGAEGKTTLALRLAMILSEAERSHVALVEGNLERPSVARALGLHVPEGAGLSSQIRRRLQGGSGPFGVVRIAPSLVVMAEPGQSSVYSEALHSTHFEGAIAALRRTYDYVVIDGSSVLGSGDANVLESLSDCMILVARAGITRRADLRRAESQLGDRHILGTVLNDIGSYAWGETAARRTTRRSGT